MDESLSIPWKSLQQGKFPVVLKFVFRGDYDKEKGVPKPLGNMSIVIDFFCILPWKASLTFKEMKDIESINLSWKQYSEKTVVQKMRTVQKYLERNYLVRIKLDLSFSEQIDLVENYSQQLSKYFNIVISHSEYRILLEMVKENHINFYKTFQNNTKIQIQFEILENQNCSDEILRVQKLFYNKSTAKYNLDIQFSDIELRIETRKSFLNWHHWNLNYLFKIYFSSAIDLNVHCANRKEQLYLCSTLLKLEKLRRKSKIKIYVSLIPSKIVSNGLIWSYIKIDPLFGEDLYENLYAENISTQQFFLLRYYKTLISVQEKKRKYEKIKQNEKDKAIFGSQPIHFYFI
eukprot:snap_masked-scaffold_3-processed-gene-21.75-mRNA-1 protein AED:1.00 eAED:1.00 QI:0/0/0/0/1/1/2/0/345